MGVCWLYFTGEPHILVLGFVGGWELQLVLSATFPGIPCLPQGGCLPQEPPRTVPKAWGHKVPPVWVAMVVS